MRYDGYMNTEELLRQTLRAVLAVTNETYNDMAGAIGQGRNSIQTKMSGRTRWNVGELEMVAHHWGLRPIDLLQGPAHAVAALLASPHRRVGAA